MSRSESASSRVPAAAVWCVEPALPPRLSAEELAASCAQVLAEWNGRDPVWLFGYGSLIWKPDLEFDRRVHARVYGYHRKLCLRSVLNRGTFEYPGLVAGLDRGGSCVGVAFRLPAPTVSAQFTRLWEREMFMGSYAPRWVLCRPFGHRRALRALAFVVRPAAFNYCGNLPEEETIAILARASGRYGTSLDYLLRTVEALRAEGLCDPHLERLAQRALRALEREDGF
ncbi:MAG TPA: gamma-glutamylcyclotransferase [Burkholderiaceae bacterium]|nr:gamma-glutamylcyclotransferase [Burkholderiaceae bacterium]